MSAQAPRVPIGRRTGDVRIAYWRARIERRALGSAAPVAVFVVDGDLQVIGIDTGLHRRTLKAHPDEMIGVYDALATGDEIEQDLRWAADARFAGLWER